MHEQEITDLTADMMELFSNPPGAAADDVVQPEEDEPSENEVGAVILRGNRLVKSPMVAFIFHTFGYLQVVFRYGFF